VFILLIVIVIWADQTSKADAQRSYARIVERSRVRQSGSRPIVVPQKRRTSFWRQVGQLFKLVGQFIMARKRKICPFIILPE
jgi:hypothetical protein